MLYLPAHGASGLSLSETSGRWRVRGSEGTPCIGLVGGLSAKQQRSRAQQAARQVGPARPHTPARYANYPWIATVIQGYTASVEGVALVPLDCTVTQG